MHFGESVPYPWAVLATYLTLMRDDVPQRSNSLLEIFNGLRFMARTGLQWRYMPHDLPPWQAVYQQTRRWLAADVFGDIIADLRELIQPGEGRAAQPTAMIPDSRTLQSTPESGALTGWDGAKRRKGSKVHLAVDTFGHLLALHVTPANVGDRAQVAEQMRHLRLQDAPHLFGMGHAIMDLGESTVRERGVESILAI